MSEPLLRVEGLEVSYAVEDARLRALRDVSLDVAPGEIVGIVGESGCGKSTLSSAVLRLLAGNAEVDGGRVLFEGRDLLALSEDEMRDMRGRSLAMIFQDPMTTLNPTFTVGQQLVDAQRAHRSGSRAAQRRRAIEALAEVGLPDAAERIVDYPHQFSGGQRQRIMIATALLLEPALLIADEPTSALDVTLEAKILELLRRLRRDHGTAILFISHDLGVVARLCDRMMVMYAGRVVEEGPVDAVFADPLHPYTRALLAAMPSSRARGGRLATIPGRVPSLASPPAGCAFADRCRYAEPEFREREPALVDIGGHRVRCHRYDSESWHALPRLVAEEAAERGGHEAAADLDDVLVEVRDLRVHYSGRAAKLLRRSRGAVRAVDGVSLAVRRGEIVGLVGESGSGKTTLGETIVRLLPPTGGEVRFDGRDITAVRGRELRRFRERAQMIFQDPYSSLSPRRRVSALITEPYAINDVPPAERRDVDELLEMVGLPSELAGKYPNQLSGGQARRVGIARALALEPEFLVADEPTAGLDVSAAAAILNLMKDLRERLGLTYVVITHNLELVSFLADRIAVMYLGRVVEVGPTERIFAAASHPYTRTLLAAGRADGALPEESHD